MKRRAPESGYVGGVKNHYRRNVWATFREAAKRQGWARGSCHVLLMPSIEGKEIEVAEAAGFRRDHMHVVDENPAIVATLQRKYPGFHSYGVDVGVAAERIAAKGIAIRFANLDLCGQVSRTLSHDLARFAQSGCLDDMAYVAVTQLRGRETAEAKSYMHQSIGVGVRPELKETWKAVFARLSEFDVSRALFVGGHLAYRPGERPSAVFPLRCEIYRSTAGTQTMMWSVWQIVQPPKAYFHINPNVESELARLSAGV